ncbi:MAG: hypothetical protein KF773_28790 [Deltaproteobacteria bacterium]|nr:hypothetical protein [Deltaproteobacteria bacterium]MCW5808097.1 hypothetical protein [Deltaproteobacteria bacterium]
MTVRLLTISTVLFATAAVASADAKKAPAPAPAKAPAPKGPVAPAKEAPAPVAAPSPTPTGTPAPTTPASPGAPVEMPEDPPPRDMDGRDENPDRPKGVGVEDDQPAIVVPVKKPMKSAYPVEEVLRPITLPQNMSEVGIAPHAQLSPYLMSDALRARYGITRQVQLGLTYLLGGVFDDPKTPAMVSDKIGVHAGKAVGLDLTVLLTDWMGVRLGVPVYINPVAVSLQLGVPMKFIVSDKFAFGGLDDLLTITLKEFPPSFYQEQINATFANNAGSGTVKSRGGMRVSGFGQYQWKPKTAMLARAGVNVDDFSSTATASGGGLTTFLRAGLQWTPRKYVDLGFSLGFDDLGDVGSFGPAGILNFRI